MNIDLDKLIPGSNYFRWTEMLYCRKWSVHVFPSEIQYRNIIQFMKKADQVRDYLNCPMIVTSGLRPVKYNNWSPPYGINGSKWSAHKIGLAMDFVTPGIRPDRVRTLLKPMLEQFNIRMENYRGSSWIHIDGREPSVAGRYFRYL